MRFRTYFFFSLIFLFFSCKYFRFLLIPACGTFLISEILRSNPICVLIFLLQSNCNTIGLHINGDDDAIAQNRRYVWLYGKRVFFFFFFFSFCCFLFVKLVHLWLFCCLCKYAYIWQITQWSVYFWHIHSKFVRATIL